MSGSSWPTPLARGTPPGLAFTPVDRETWEERRQDLQKLLAEAEELESQFAAGQEPPGSDSLTRSQAQGTIAVVRRILERFPEDRPPP